MYVWFYKKKKGSNQKNSKQHRKRTKKNSLAEWENIVLLCSDAIKSNVSKMCIQWYDGKINGIHRQKHTYSDDIEEWNCRKNSFEGKKVESSIYGFFLCQCRAKCENGIPTDLFFFVTVSILFLSELLWWFQFSYGFRFGSVAHSSHHMSLI